MGGFLYFLDGDRRPMTAERVRELGLGYILDGANSVAYREAQGQTPSRGPGLTFGVAERQGGRELKLDAAQTWRPMPTTFGDGRLYVGFWKDAKPRPADLARAKQLPGPSLELADGERWQIPRVLSLDVEARRYSHALPCVWDCDADGNWIRGEIVDQYRHLWDICVPFADERFEVPGEQGPQRELSDAAMLTAAATLLQANYVVGQAELAALKVLADDDATALIPLLACEFFELVRWLEAQKKSGRPTEKPGADTAAGEPA